MRNVSKKDDNEDLGRIKRTVANTYQYFEHNYTIYNDFKRFVYESSLTADEITLLMSMNRPQLEFNVLEAYLSRLVGEFSKQEPDIEVNAFDENRADPITIKVVQQHLKHVFSDYNNEHLRKEVYSDLLSGGFSVVKVLTDYQHSMSMQQMIKFEKCEPTLCGFDIQARTKHKGDGNYCFELFPKSKKDFEIEYPEVSTNAINFTRKLGGFNWSYINDKSEVILVCDYYEKKKKEVTIFSVRDRGVMTQTAYKKMIDEWNDITMPPAITSKSRKTIIDEIVRYRLIDNMIIDIEHTDYELLPLVYIDGNSQYIKTPKNGNIRQLIRPYVYHARDAQRLKNWAGISLANDIENMTQAKLKVAKEALPKEPEFRAAYDNPQQANLYVFNSVHEGNPDLPINNPISEVVKVPTPPEVLQAFTGADSLIQNVLGSYDASLGINNNQLSGIAIIEAASQSNATAMPYINGALDGFQRLAQIYVSLMPKYVVTPTTIPIIDEDGKRHYVKVNQEDGVDMDFEPNALNVSLKAGASFQVQKSRTIMMVKEMMGMSPLFAQFMAEKGLKFILDNMEGKGIEELKVLTEEWLVEYEKEKAQAQEAAQQNPAAMKMQLDTAKLKQQEQKNQQQFQIDVAKLQHDQEKVMADLSISDKSANVQLVKALTEKFAKETDLKIKHLDLTHRHAREVVETRHKLKHNIPNKNNYR